MNFPSRSRNLKLVAIAGGLSLAGIGLVENMKLRTSSTLDGDTRKAPISETTGGPLLAVNNMSYRNPANSGNYRDVVDEMYGTNNTPTVPSVLARIHEKIPENTPHIPGAIVRKPNPNAGSRIADTKEYYGINSPTTNTLIIDVSLMPDDQVIQIVEGQTWKFFNNEDRELFAKIVSEMPYFQLPENVSKREKFLFQILLGRAAREQGTSGTTYEEASDRIRAEAEAMVPKKPEKTFNKNPQ